MHATLGSPRICLQTSVHPSRSTTSDLRGSQREEKAPFPRAFCLPSDLKKLSSGRQSSVLYTQVSVSTKSEQKVWQCCSKYWKCGSLQQRSQLPGRMRVICKICRWRNLYRHCVSSKHSKTQTITPSTLASRAVTSFPTCIDSPTSKS